MRNERRDSKAGSPLTTTTTLFLLPACPSAYQHLMLLNCVPDCCRNLASRRQVHSQRPNMRPDRPLTAWTPNSQSSEIRGRESVDEKRNEIALERPLQTEDEGIHQTILLSFPTLAESRVNAWATIFWRMETQKNGKRKMIDYTRPPQIPRDRGHWTCCSTELLSAVHHHPQTRKSYQATKSKHLCLQAAEADQVRRTECRRSQC